MIRKQGQLIVKNLDDDDWQAIARLIHAHPKVHRHLGWRPPLDWLGSGPYLGAFKGEELVGVLACPPNEDGVTWLRLLAYEPGQNPEEIWDRLWPAAKADLAERRDVESVSVLIMHPWLEEVLLGSSFRHTYDVIVMEWDASHGTYPSPLGGVQIRKMKERDLEKVYGIDQAAFDPLWRNSLPSLRVAYKIATLAGVALVEGELAGYYISTADTLGGHLARLAVDPDYQGRGVGTALVRHVLRSFESMGMVRVSVNTQKDNLASIKLYQKFGFSRKDESYPVYQYFFSG
ncbi:MAG: GNAT family N-acetyltransferase [Anaerolineales bacterium]